MSASSTSQTHLGALQANHDKIEEHLRSINALETEFCEAAASLGIELLRATEFISQSRARIHESKVKVDTFQQRCFQDIEQFQIQMLLAKRRNLESDNSLKDAASLCKSSAIYQIELAVVNSIRTFLNVLMNINPMDQNVKCKVDRINSQYVVQERSQD